MLTPVSAGTREDVQADHSQKAMHCDCCRDVVVTRVPYVDARRLPGSRSAGRTQRKPQHLGRDQRPLHCTAPTFELNLARRLVHSRLEAPVAGPGLGKLLPVRPDAGAASSKPGDAERSRFEDDRAVDGSVEQVC